MGDTSLFLFLKCLKTLLYGKVKEIVLLVVLKFHDNQTPMGHPFMISTKHFFDPHLPINKHPFWIPPPPECVFVSLISTNTQFSGAGIHCNTNNLHSYLFFTTEMFVIHYKKLIV